MKRLLVLLCVLALAGCSNADGGKESASPSSLVDRPIAVVEGSSSSGDLEVFPDWGVALTAKDVTPTGLTIVCTQSGGKDVTELTSGEYYWLEELHGDHWHKCEIVFEGNAAFTLEAWIIPLDDSVEWAVDWEWLYGELSPGTYRIAKEIMNFHGTGVYDKADYYAEFTIE